MAPSQQRFQGLGVDRCSRSRRECDLTIHAHDTPELVIQRHTCALSYLNVTARAAETPILRHWLTPRPSRAKQMPITGGPFAEQVRVTIAYRGPDFLHPVGTWSASLAMRAPALMLRPRRVMCQNPIFFRPLLFTLSNLIISIMCCVYCVTFSF